MRDDPAVPRLTASACYILRGNRATGGATRSHRWVQRDFIIAIEKRADPNREDAHKSNVEETDHACCHSKERRKRDVEHSSMARFQDSWKDVIFNLLKFRPKKRRAGSLSAQSIERLESASRSENWLSKEHRSIRFALCVRLPACLPFFNLLHLGRLGSRGRTGRRDQDAFL